MRILIRRSLFYKSLANDREDHLVVSFELQFKATLYVPKRYAVIFISAESWSRDGSISNSDYANSAQFS
jgi:hypothetical protein